MSYSGRPLKKGWIGRIRNGEIDGFYDFQYNPTETTESVNPQYTMIDPPGSPVPTAVFKSISNDEIAFQLLLDATDPYYQEQLGIWAQQSFLESLARPELATYLEGMGQFVAPPRVVLGLGPRIWDCVLTSYSFKTIRWNREMIPTRGFADVAFKTVFVDFDTLSGQYQELFVYRDMAELKGV
jgi:hypothetical protein